MIAEVSSRTDQLQYAGLGRRFLALVVDFLIFSLVFFPVTRMVKGTWLMTSGDHLWGYGWLVTDPLCLTFLVVIVLYFVLLEGAFGATLGKGLLGLRVVQEDGGRPGVMRSLIRNLLRAVDSLPALNILGVLLIVTSPQRARFGDRVAHTRVIVSR